MFQALQFQRSLDDMEQSLVLVEKELANEDCGADLPSVNRLLKAVQALEEELDGLRDRMKVQWLHLCRSKSCLPLNFRLTVVLLSDRL